MEILENRDGEVRWSFWKKKLILSINWPERCNHSCSKAKRFLSSGKRSLSTLKRCRRRLRSFRSWNTSASECSGYRASRRYSSLAQGKTLPESQLWWESVHYRASWEPSSLVEPKATQSRVLDKKRAQKRRILSIISRSTSLKEIRSKFRVKMSLWLLKSPLAICSCKKRRSPTCRRGKT